jgi:RNA polymerase sigma-70 factor (ECF subfamily)
MPRYERRGVPFTAWLLRIACNLAINHKKALKNGVHSQLPDTIPCEDADSAPEESCAAKVDGQQIWEQVKTLPPDQRQVIVMRFLDDLSYPDIARLLGKSVGAVRVIQFRALANLRTRMDTAPAVRLKPAVNGNGNGHTNGNGRTAKAALRRPAA